MDPARRVFADTLRKWFAANDWPQAITEAWAKSCGSPGPWASQISPAINCKYDPKAIFFISLGHFNQAVAERDLLSVTNERIRGLLMAGQPLCHDDGVPYDGADFFRLFTGLLEPPSEYQAPQEPANISEYLNDKRMASISNLARQAFQDVASAKGLTPGALWQKIRPFLSEYLDAKQLEHMLNVLSGWETLDPEMPCTLVEMGHSECLLVTALRNYSPVSVAESEGCAALKISCMETFAAIGRYCTKEAKRLNAA